MAAAPNDIFTKTIGALLIDTVKTCVDNGMSKQEITIVTGMKSHLIDEYLKIIKEINA